MKEEEAEREFLEIAKVFRKLAQLLAVQETFDSMSLATVAVGLAQVAESLALVARRREGRES